MQPGNFLIILSALVGTNAFKIATYNIWNQMFSWPIRRRQICDQIKFNKVDVIGLQEVRGGDQPSSTSQISELRSLLPRRYQWSIYQPANKITPVLNSSATEYMYEGIGVISSIPIVSTFTHPLKHDRFDPDKNQRVLLHVVLREQEGRLINVLVLHLSYHKQQQCKNVAEIISYIQEKNLQNVIVLGDLNTYKDYEGPVRLFIEGKLVGNPCRNILRGTDWTDFGGLKDAWKQVHATDHGLTFSNMQLRNWNSPNSFCSGRSQLRCVISSPEHEVLKPFPGMESRPDRILVSKSIQVKSASLHGYGKEYTDTYMTSLLLQRFLTLARSSSRSYQGLKGYHCVHDCGPRGSCQCGVCINQTKADCLLQNCKQCDKTMYKNLVFYTIISLLLSFHLLYAIFAILIIGSNSYGDAVYSILGFSCCLFSKDLFVSRLQSYKRKYKILHVCRIWPLFKLPAYLQLLLYLAGFAVLYFRVKVVFAPALSITYNIMSEEMFPSDHLMLLVDLDI